MKYKLYRSTTPGGQDLGKAPLVTLSKTTLGYDDLAVTNGTTYHYVVVATNALGASAPSAQVSATPQASVPLTPPAAPTGLTATALPGANRLAWTAPTDTGGAPVTSYRVYRGVAPGPVDLATPVATTSATTVDDAAGLVPGTTYTYVVRAVNQAGEGAASAPADVTAQPGVPGEPVLGGSVGPGPSAVLTWTVPPDGGSPITKYVVLRDALRLVTLSVDELGGATTYTDTTLLPGQTAVYQVKAVNAVGSGPLSSKVTLTAP
jgi:predicted phage tail protein